jgi:hypothetical protein
VVGRVELDADGEAGRHDGADGGQDVEDEFGAVGGGAAVCVGAFVRLGELLSYLP